MTKAEGRRQTAEVFKVRKAVLTSAFCLLTSALTQAQTNPYTPAPVVPLGDTLLTLPTAHIGGPAMWEVKFTHRFNQSIDQGSFSDRVHSLFGLDSNADVGLGLSYVWRPRLQFSLYRSNAMDDIELGAKYIAFQQAAAIPFSAALRVGTDLRTEKDLDDRTSLFAQAILSRQFGPRVEVFIAPTYATKAGRAVVDASSQALFKNAFNAPLGAAFMIRNGLSVVGELYPKNRDLPDGVDADYGWAIGFKRAVGGHHFEILLTNNNATHVDQYITSTYMGSPLRRGDLHIGFNIERRFGGGSY
jgi:hypothetical protein